MKSLLTLFQDEDRNVTAAVFFIVIVMISFFGPMDLSTAQDKTNVGFDMLVLIKLVVSLAAACCAVWGCLKFEDVRKTLITVPALLFAAIFLLAMIGSTSGITSTSIPMAVINAFSVVFAITAIKTVGLRIVRFGTICGVVGTALCALFLFCFVPEKGVFAEPLDAGHFLNRMGGMAHPNSVARSVIVGCLLTLYLYRTDELTLKGAGVLLLLFGLSAYFAMSRTAIIAGTVGCMMLFADRLTSRWSLVAFASMTMAGALAVLLLVAVGREERLVGKVVGLVSKSGNASELTSGTGRTEIWFEAARQIAKRPLIGYGFNAGPALLINHSQATHNALMNVTLSAGIFAGMAMIALLAWTGWNALNSPNLVIRALCSFLLLSCLTEDTVFETFPGPCTMMWYVCGVLPVLNLTTVNTLVKNYKPVRNQATTVSLTR